MSSVKITYPFGIRSPPLSAVAQRYPEAGRCLKAGAPGRGVGRGDRDRDGQAALITGAGDGGAAVDRGDGRDDGEAEPEAVVGRAVAEPLERLEQPADLAGRYDRAGIGHGQPAA